MKKNNIYLYLSFLSKILKKNFIELLKYLYIEKSYTKLNKLEHHPLLE